MIIYRSAMYRSYLQSSINFLNAPIVIASLRILIPWNSNDSARLNILTEYINVVDKCLKSLLMVYFILLFILLSRLPRSRMS